MQSFNCKCPERRKPIAQRNWVILKYKVRHSAFDGYHAVASDYSTVSCQSCNAVGRTKAGFVEALRRKQNTQ